MVELNSVEELTPSVIKKIIENHQGNDLPRMRKLEKYYNAKNEILSRVMTDESKPNNKIANPYASYITDTLVGYFIGEPVSYTCNDENLLKDLQMIYEYNDEADENAELAKNASIYGVAYEMLYMSGEENMIRFKSLSPKEVIPIFDKTVNNNLIAAIRYYEDFDYIDNTNHTIVEIITDKEVRRYVLKGDFSLIESYPHYFNAVPIAIYKNNEEEVGDFEKVISLIDAYDKMESDTLNDFEYFCDAYLALYGFTAENEDIVEMKKNRVLLMDEGTNAEWLTKETADNHIENMKNRLDKDIHKFSKCPNLSDEEFASNASGIAIKFKLLGTENLVAIKERKFKRGLQQRLELISFISSLIRDRFDWRAIEIHFSRNIPANDQDIANVVNLLRDLVSDETLLAQIPFVEDVQKELEKLKKEREEKKDSNPFFTTGLEYETRAEKKDKEGDDEE